MYPAAATSEARKKTVHMIAGSFAAGVGAMVFLGLIAPMAAQGGLSIRDAVAATMEPRAPLVAPLDVAAIEAQLAQADAQMQATRAQTDGAINRLDQLSNR